MLNRIAVPLLFAVMLPIAACDRKPVVPPTPPERDVAPGEAGAAEAQPLSPMTGEPAGPIEVGANDWPWWRGPSTNGVAPATAKPVTTWSATQNVAWSVDVPGRGHASPIVVGDRVIVATCDEDAGTQSLICYDRNDGTQRWATQLHQGTLPEINRKNSHASLTPACDGRFIYAMFVIDDALWVDAVDLDGKVVWQKPYKPYRSEHGHGASPILHKHTLLVSGEDHNGGHLMAIARANGAPIWRVARQMSGTHANYATPNVGAVAGREQLIIHGYDKVTSYDPATGEPLWWVAGPTEVCANTPLLGDDRVYISGGYPRKNVMAIRADGTGDVTDTHVAWTDGKGVAYVPSSVLHNDRLYVVDDKGIASCYNATTGENLWRQRLDGDFTASLTLVGDTLYIPGEHGKTFVFKAADTFELVAANELPEGTLATPAFSGNDIFFRTRDKLYRIAASAAE